jgi:hypothetical protein
MRTTLLYFTLLLSGAIFGQFLDNTEGQTFGETPYFNTSFVKQNKIKSITGYYSTKADLDYIRKTKDTYTYEFNETGQLIREFKVMFKDTSISTYFYTDSGELSILRRSDKNGFHSYHYTYDRKGRILAEEYRRDINKKKALGKFELDKSFIVSTDRFEYVDFDSLRYKKIFYNSAGKIFKEEFYYLNEDGYLLKIEGRLKMGSAYNSTTFNYDYKGRVSEKIKIVKLMGEKTEKWVYEYDDHDNVQAQFYYKNDAYTTEHQIVYEPETMLLKAVIMRDEPTNFLTILQFSEYTYFN